MRHVDDLGVGNGLEDPVDHELTGHAGDRLLSRPVHVGHQDEVGPRDAGPELAPERLDP